jgi:hypothetical protein
MPPLSAGFFHVLLSDPADTSDIFLRNIGLPPYMALEERRALQSWRTLTETKGPTS